jgi:parvulin-like peptidyl-prolyl isomerase
VIRRTSARLVALALVLVVAAVAAGCSSTLRDAATITYDNDGDEQTAHIRRDDFEQQVSDLAASETIMQSLSQQGIESKPDGTADANLSAFWLTRLVYAVAVDAEFDARGLEVTDEQRQQVEASFEGLDDLSQNMIDQLKAQQERELAVLDDVGKDVPDAAEPTDAELQQLFEQNREALAACESGKEVSHILVEDQATADQLAQQLADGASFAELAADASTDTGSAAAGGSLGCLGAQPFVTEFQQAADAAPLDQVVGPVQSEFGYHLILVTAWNPTFEKFRPQLAQQVANQSQQQVQQQRQQLFTETISGRLEGMNVDVDPRFGTWETADGNFRVAAPASPEPREQREPSTTTTTVPLLGG